MNLAISQKIQSPESAFITECFSHLSPVVLNPWDIRSHTEEYDVSISIGPVDNKPLSRKSILFVMGQTRNHNLDGFDQIFVTSEKSKMIVEEQGGKADILIPPVIGHHIGRNRIFSRYSGMINASDIDDIDDVRVMSLWSGDCEPFDPLEFNTLIRAGGVGYYPDEMEDGYDIQVRRHLSLGGRVLCRRDGLVLGDMLNMIDENGMPIGSVDAGNVFDYQEKLRNIVDA